MRHPPTPSQLVEFGPRKVLLIEDSIADAQLLRLLLRADPRVSVTTATRLVTGLAHLAREHFELVLLDLSLPDGGGIEAICRVSCAARDVPIVALHAVHDEALALESLRKGAQDWLVKSEIDRAVLLRVIRYACERHRLLAALQDLALTDGLTGLYNRRGFLTIAEEQFKLARRTGHGLSLAFVDLDGMKRINDELGHESGDQALLATATILRATFRASDIIARLGGDEFVVLLVATGPVAAGRARKRLLQSLAQHNRTAGGTPLAFSIGFAHFEPSASERATLDDMLAEADRAMYEEKRSRRGSRASQEKRVRVRA